MQSSVRHFHLSQRLRIVGALAAESNWVTSAGLSSVVPREAGPECRGFRLDRCCRSASFTPSIVLRAGSVAARQGWGGGRFAPIRFSASSSSTDARIAVPQGTEELSPAFQGMLRNGAVPSGLESNFPLNPALRLRLRAGLRLFRAFGTGFRQSCSTVVRAH